MNDSVKYKAYHNAKKRVREESAFYRHIGVYILINICIIVFKIEITTYIDHPDVTDFLPWNLIATPVLWGIGLLAHGLWTFRKLNGLEKLFRKSFLSKEWEQEKIKEIMDADQDL